MTCHHIPADMAPWYAAHPRLVCARCWIERGPERREAQPVVVGPVTAVVDVEEAPRLFA